ncbi:MAG TPA: fibronectin type III domain-containing protein [Deltaproteobacteria bacterium]|nr:fibronectin type III domain-containing protein [Deltaproteobacteria bacterium]HPR51501.1 fibronectin type III domain-containing protein [Deltaproteobacteria bacterium]
MKITQTIKTLILIVVMVFLTDFAYAATVRLSWDSNTEPDLAGYIVYYGTSSRSYMEYFDAGLTTSVDVADLTAATPYFFAVTAYDTSGNESSFSSEAYIFIPAEDGEILPDSDLDGIPDAVEVSLGMSATDPLDSLLDTDCDGAVNLVEYMEGTSPLNADDRPDNDDLLLDMIGEAGEQIDLSGITSGGLYSIVPLLASYPEPVNDILQTTTPGALLYNVIDENSELVYRLRVSLSGQLSALGDYEPGYAMNLEDTSYGIRVELSADAVLRVVPIGIGTTGEEPASAVDYENETLEFDLLPYGLVLANPAFVTVAYDGENPAVQHYDPASDTWENIDGVESYDGTVSFSTQELGSYKVYSEEESAEVPASDGGGGGGGGCFITTAGF